MKNPKNRLRYKEFENRLKDITENGLEKMDKQTSNLLAKSINEMVKMWNITLYHRDNDGK